VILREGTEDSQGKGQIISNINACAAVVDIVRTTLGKFKSHLFINLNILLNRSKRNG
jgi:hypothetical protein